MKWEGRKGSKNVNDMRGQSSGGGGLGGGGLGGGLPGGFRIPTGGSGRGGSGGGLGGGLGCGSIALLLIIFLLFNSLGGGLGDILGGGNSGGTSTNGGGTGIQVPGGSTTQSTTNNGGVNKTGRSDDEMADFISVVLADTEELWAEQFRKNGETYSNPTMNIFDGQIRGACGIQSAAVGPFYCPGDQTVNIDLSFYRQLTEQIGAQGGDFAMGYVIAHEVGHHVQNLLGISEQVNAYRNRVSEKEFNQLSVRQELQADYLAGVWARWEADQGYIEVGDLDEAMDAADKIGDDALQKKSQGFVVPDSFTHGTSEQRRRWFMKGYEAGDLSEYDTFNIPYEDL